MPKIREFERITALYERLSKDDEQQGESNSIPPLRGFALCACQSFTENHADASFPITVFNFFFVAAYSRFCKWRDDGALLRVFQALNADTDYENLCVHSASIKAHSQSAGKRGDQFGKQQVYWN